MHAFLKTLSSNLFGFERPETRGGRVFFRVFEAFVAGAMGWMVWRWGLYLPRIADVAWPLGVAQYVDVSFLLGGARGLLAAALISGLLVAGFARLWRGAYLGALLLAHVQYVARFSLGKVQHGSVLVGMALLGLALAMLAFDAPRTRRRFAMGFAYFFVGLSYPLASACKLIGTGLHWPDGRHLWLWVYEKGIDGFARTGALDFNLAQQLALSDWGLATAMLTAALLTEMGAVLMWWRRYRLPVGVAVLGMHLSIYLMMGIAFWANMALLVLLAFPWARWIERAWPPARRQRDAHPASSEPTQARAG